jgi:hypothetical protein
LLIKKSEPKAELESEKKKSGPSRARELRGLLPEGLDAKGTGYQRSWLAGGPAGRWVSWQMDY